MRVEGPNFSNLLFDFLKCEKSRKFSNEEAIAWASGAREDVRKTASGSFDVQA